MTGPGWMQLQPAFASVTSVTPWESADAVPPEETAPADDGVDATDTEDAAVGVPIPSEPAHPASGSATTAVSDLHTAAFPYRRTGMMHS